MDTLTQQLATAFENHAPTIPRVLEEHKGWNLVAYEVSGHFHSDGDYRNYCSNCAAHRDSHFRGGYGRCPNRIDVVSA